MSISNNTSFLDRAHDRISSIEENDEKTTAFQKKFEKVSKTNQVVKSLPNKFIIYLPSRGTNDVDWNGAFENKERTQIVCRHISNHVIQDIKRVFFLTPEVMQTMTTRSRSEVSQHIFSEKRFGEELKDILQNMSQKDTSYYFSTVIHSMIIRVIKKPNGIVVILYDPNNTKTYFRCLALNQDTVSALKLNDFLDNSIIFRYTGGLDYFKLSLFDPTLTKTDYRDRTVQGIHVKKENKYVLLNTSDFGYVQNVLNYFILSCKLSSLPEKESFIDLFKDYLWFIEPLQEDNVLNSLENTKEKLQSFDEIKKIESSSSDEILKKNSLLLIALSTACIFLLTTQNNPKKPMVLQSSRPNHTLRKRIISPTPSLSSGVRRSYNPSSSSLTRIFNSRGWGRGLGRLFRV